MKFKSITIWLAFVSVVCGETLQANKVHEPAQPLPQAAKTQSSDTQQINRSISIESSHNSSNALNTSLKLDGVSELDKSAHKASISLIYPDEHLTVKRKQKGSNEAKRGATSLILTASGRLKKNSDFSKLFHEHPKSRTKPIEAGNENSKEVGHNDSDRLLVDAAKAKLMESGLNTNGPSREPNRDPLRQVIMSLGGRSDSRLPFKLQLTNSPLTKQTNTMRPLNLEEPLQQSVAIDRKLSEIPVKEGLSNTQSQVIPSEEKPSADRNLAFLTATIESTTKKTKSSKMTATIIGKITGRKKPKLSKEELAKFREKGNQKAKEKTNKGANGENKAAQPNKSFTELVLLLKDVCTPIDALTDESSLPKCVRINLSITAIESVICTDPLAPEQRSPHWVIQNHTTSHTLDYPIFHITLSTKTRPELTTTDIVARVKTMRLLGDNELFLGMMDNLCHVKATGDDSAGVVFLQRFNYGPLTNYLDGTIYDHDEFNRFNQEVFHKFALSMVIEQKLDVLREMCLVPRVAFADFFAFENSYNFLMRSEAGLCRVADCDYSLKFYKYLNLEKPSKLAEQTEVPDFAYYQLDHEHPKFNHKLFNKAYLESPVIPACREGDIYRFYAGRLYVYEHFLKKVIIKASPTEKETKATAKIEEAFNEFWTDHLNKAFEIFETDFSKLYFNYPRKGTPTAPKIEEGQEPQQAEIKPKSPLAWLYMMTVNLFMSNAEKAVNAMSFFWGEKVKIRNLNDLENGVIAYYNTVRHMWMWRVRFDQTAISENNKAQSFSESDLD